jgi:hypothetical protein
VSAAARKKPNRQVLAVEKLPIRLAKFLITLHLSKPVYLFGLGRTDAFGLPKAALAYSCAKMLKINGF